MEPAVGIDSKSKSWIVGLETLMKMIILLKFILEDAPVGELPTNAQTTYVEIRKKYMEWITDLESFIPLDYEYLKTLHERKASYPPKLPNLDRMNREKYCRAYDAGISLSQEVLKFVESYHSAQPSGIAATLGGGIIGCVLGYIGAGLLVVASPPIAMVGGAFLGGGIGYSMNGNPKVSFWLKQINDHTRNLRLLITSQPVVFAEGEDSVQMVNEMSNLRVVVDSGFLKRL